MTNPQIVLKLEPNEPSLSDLLNTLKREIFLDLNCHHLATIQSFDSAKQSVTATMNYTKTIFELNEKSKLYSPVQHTYPTMVDMPAIVLGGGPVRLTMPIAKGDQALILFNDRSIDNWFQSGQVGPLSSPRAHSFADGIALVGLNSLATSISGYDAVRALLTNGTVKLGVNPQNNKLVLTNGTSLNTLLQNLCTQLETLANTNAVNGSPLNPSVASQITSIATSIGELIE